MSKRVGGKSIIASFGALSSKTADERDEGQGSAESTPPARPLSRVGAGIIGATQRSLVEIREERDRLQELVAKGTGLELDPNNVDPSPFPDRLPDDSEAEFEAFKKGFEEEGQKVPIQVRVNPAAPGRYQVVYGHRRWRAAKELGLPVKAILMDLSDTDLAIAQGIENAIRQDLSWIERALFVWRMDGAGVKSRDIKAALGIDDPELARLRAVTRAVPIEIIEAIGRAPKAGRPRWTALAEAIGSQEGALDRVRQTLSADKVGTSDERFRKALAAAVRVSPQRSIEVELRDEAGTMRGKAVFGRRDVRLKMEKDDGGAFVEFLRDELPSLVEKFVARKGGG